MLAAEVATTQQETTESGPVLPPDVVDISSEVISTLALFRAPADGGETELMLDRAGNIRARWTAAGRRGLPDADTLGADADRVARLAVTAQSPDPRNPAMVPLPLEADLVAPRPDRLAVFDGRLTHGVLDARNQVPVGRLRRRGQLRLTLVMNGWALRPRQVPTFEEARVYRALATR